MININSNKKETSIMPSSPRSNPQPYKPNHGNDNTFNK